MQKATLGGGCFWCMDAVFRRLKGVSSTVVGYAGGKTENPTMEQVYRGDTGHAECVQVTFDPAVLSYEALLDVFFHLHDPTVTQQPGTGDSGPEYRSVIFYHSDEQKKTAETVMAAIGASGVYKNRLLTELVAYQTFYPAQESQQEYYEKNSYQPYCQIIIDPKIQKLLTAYSSQVKDEFRHV